MTVPAFRVASLTFALLVAALAAGARPGDPSSANWPPPLRAVPDASPPLTPADALKTFTLPPGYRVELVAAEPLIQDPVVIDWDPDGRIWAVEMPGYMRDVTGAGEHDPLGRIVVLEDTDRDGRFDRRTVFAEGLVMARAIEVLDRGVLVGEPPHVWLMRDVDGDLHADTKEAVTDRYGRREIDPQNNANAFDWNLDNRLYTAGQSDIVLRLHDGAFAVSSTLRRGQWGVTHDDQGRVYRNTNESALHVDVMPTPYFARSPNLLRTRGSYDRLADANPDLNVVWPIRRTPGLNRAYQFGILRDDGSLAKFTAVCAPLVYRGHRLPAELNGNVFVAEPAANLVSRIVLEDEDGTVRARKAYERGEFLASTDERFRPVYLTNAPDGTLYVVDMYRGILEHRLSMTEYLRDQILTRRLAGPIGMGRIYRIVHETTRRDTARVLGNESPAELIGGLSHPSGWWRDTAQRLLVERLQTRRELEPDAIASLARLMTTSPDWRTRLHAIWTLDGIGAVEPQHVEHALGDANGSVRAAAIRIAERWLADPVHPLQTAMPDRMTDPDPAVRRQLAASLGELPGERRVRAIVRLLDRHGDDPILLDAALSGLRGLEPAALETMMAAGEAHSPAREAAITMLAATIIRGGQEAPVQELFGRIAGSTHPAWQRSALLRGGEVALLGAAMPGTLVVQSRPAAVAAPCPTCPGGRLGPGGAYAHPRPASAAPAGRSAPVLRLNREPGPLRTFSDQDPLRARLDAVLQRVVWPGKTGAPEPVAPLSAADGRRFEAGREVYRNICQACHQPDGRGQDRIAPSLVGSALTLGDPAVAARVLLNGKEGPTGLMPPIGGTLSDEEIANVLTYVRREWGQAGSPVDAATVAAVRESTKGRTRPWTDEELRSQTIR